MNELYHYTDSSGLLGILKNKSLWLTNILFMNDSSEFDDGKAVIYREIENRIEQIKIHPIPTPSDYSLGKLNQEAIIKYLNDLKMYLANSNHPDFDARNYLFILSFSRSKDLLSQWRAYCRNGGYSIEFNSDRFRNLINKHHEQMMLADCIYTSQEKTLAAKQAINEALEAFLKLVCTTGTMKEMSNNIHEAHIEQNRKLIVLAARFKHHGFHEENEVRLISNGYRNEWLSHRSSSNIIVPYLDIPIELNIINEVMVSPSNRSNKASASLSTFLSQLGLYKKIKISVSDSTYIQNE